MKRVALNINPKQLVRLIKNNKTTQAKVADTLGISRQAFNQWINKGKMPPSYLSKMTCFLKWCPKDTKRILVQDTEFFKVNIRLLIEEIAKRPYTITINVKPGGEDEQ